MLLEDYYIGVDSMQLRKKKTRDGDWVVANDSTGGHAHFDTKFGANVMIFLLKNDIEPYDPYFIEAKRRLLEDGKKNKKKKNKQRYYNNQLT